MKKRILSLLLIIAVFGIALSRNIIVYAAPEALQAESVLHYEANYIELTIITNLEVCGLSIAIPGGGADIEITNRRIVNSYQDDNANMIHGTFYQWIAPQIPGEHAGKTITAMVRACLCVYDPAGCSCLELYGICSTGTCPVITEGTATFSLVQRGETPGDPSDIAPIDLSFHLGEVRVSHTDWLYGYFLTFIQPSNVDAISNYLIRVFDSHNRNVYQSSVDNPQSLTETVYVSMHDILSSLNNSGTYSIEVVSSGKHGGEYKSEATLTLKLEITNAGEYTGDVTADSNIYDFSPQLDIGSLYFIETSRSGGRNDSMFSWYRGSDSVPYYSDYNYLTLLRLFDYNIQKHSADIRMNPPGSFNVSVPEEGNNNEFNVNLKSDASMYEALKRVTDKASAVRAVYSAVESMDSQDIEDPYMLDRLSLFTETAIRHAATLVSSDSRIQITKQSITAAENIAAETKTETLAVINNSGVPQTRELRTGIRVKTSTENTITAQLDRTLSNTSVDIIRIENENIGISINQAFLRGNAASPLTVTITEGSLDIGFNRNINDNVMIYMRPLPGDTDQQAIFNDKGAVVGGKYDPCTYTLSASINEGGVYYVRDNPKDFTDIQNKDAEMRKAIRTLASKGIITGETADRFAPDKPITRAQIATLITASLSKLDRNENGGFTDVRQSDWFFGAAGSAKKHGLMAGTNTAGTIFSPNVNIPKDQIVAISARVLREEMGYKTPTDVNSILRAYGDAQRLANWSRNDIALATREGLVVTSTDSRFNPDTVMTRGEAAVVLYRMYEKIW